MSDRAPAPVLYVTDLTFDRYDPADLFDLAYLSLSPDYDVRAICLTEDSGGERVLNTLSVRTKRNLPVVRGVDGLTAALTESDTPLNLVVVGGYTTGAAVLASDRPLFRERVARLFLVGGYANDYGADGLERLPIDPRLKDRNPERFAPTGDPRVAGQTAAFAALLTSGEGVIWLPRDICLWRYAAPGILSDGGPVTEFLLRELFAANLRDAGPDTDRYDAADSPALLSTLPALLLPTQPDPFAWMRLFRVVTARVTTDESGAIRAIETKTDTPNLYAVIAIDGQALGKRLTDRLRLRPLLP
jgi:hypothetical protein